MPFSSVSSRLTLLALFSATTFYCIYKSRRLRNLKLTLSLNPNPNTKLNLPKILFISETGTSKSLANRLHRFLSLNDVAFELIDGRSYEPEDLPKETILLIVASTWEDGKPPPAYRFFADWLAESSEDFRVGSLLLSKCRFAVFGVGSRGYGETFNAVGKEIVKRMKALGGAEMIPLFEGDVDGGDVDEVFDKWCVKVVELLNGGGGGDGDGGDLENGEEECGVLSSDEEESDEEEEEVESDIVDLEDIAGKAPSRKSVATVEETNGKLNGGKKEMVTPVIRANLVKQVYCIFCNS
jgi:tRNA wybutosine-synthesizing protein 1